jgi:putative SOS response-associated peptidase YedK
LLPFAVGVTITVMCGRYASFLPAEAIARLFGISNPLPNLAPSWNLAPSQPALVVRRHPETGERHLDVLGWGLLPHFTKDAEHARRPINARAETVTSSGMYRGAFARRRCLIPAAAFYEWKAVEGGKQPYAIARTDGEPLALGGIWESWRAPGGEIERTFAIITTRPNAEMTALHNRMPVVIGPDDWAAWLGGGRPGSAAGTAARRHVARVAGQSRRQLAAQQRTGAAGTGGGSRSYAASTSSSASRLGPSIMTARAAPSR